MARKRWAAVEASSIRRDSSEQSMSLSLTCERMAWVSSSCVRGTYEPGSVYRGLGSESGLELGL